MDGVGPSDRRVRGVAANATLSLVEAVSALYERAIDRMLVASERVTSAAEGRALLASEEGTEALAAACREWSCSPCRLRGWPREGRGSPGCRGCWWAPLRFPLA